MSWFNSLSACLTEISWTISLSRPEVSSSLKRSVMDVELAGNDQVANQIIREGTICSNRITSVRKHGSIERKIPVAYSLDLGSRGRKDCRTIFAHSRHYMRNQGWNRVAMCPCRRSQSWQTDFQQGRPDSSSTVLHRPCVLTQIEVRRGI